MKLADTVIPIDDALGERELSEVEASLAEDDRNVGILFRGRGGPWHSVGFELAKRVRPHVFRDLLREDIESFVITAVALHRTGYVEGWRAERVVVPEAQVFLFY